MINRNKNRNVVITAVARELTCFVWEWKQEISDET